MSMTPSPRGHHLDTRLYYDLYPTRRMSAADEPRGSPASSGQGHSETLAVRTFTDEATDLPGLTRLCEELSEPGMELTAG